MPALFSPEWWSALGAIIVVNLVLSGDNALVIALAARNMPARQQKRVVLWGALGAVAVRVLLTGIVVWLLRIPGFLLLGGLTLVWIGWKLTKENGEDHHSVKEAVTLREAIQTVVIADAVMGVDNVLAIGGAAQGSFLLVVVGVAISVPIVIWGSTLVLKALERFPSLLWLGAGVLGWTAAKMIASEPMIESALEIHRHAASLLYAAIVGALVLVPWWRTLSREQRAQTAVLGVMIVWVTALGWVEDRAGVEFDIFDQWRWDDEIFDLIRWVGWIPLAIPAYNAVVRRHATRGPANGH